MKHTRSLVGVLNSSSSRCSRRTVAALVISRPTTVIAATASLHTARAVAEEKRGFLSRLNPFAKPTSPTEPAAATTTTTDAARVAQDLKVEIKDEEDEEELIPSWKSKRQSLSPEQLEESIRSAAAPFVDSAPTVHLQNISFSDPKIKFQILKACVASTGQEIPSKDLVSIRTLKDLYTTMQRLDQEANALPENPTGHVVSQWFEKNKSNLPPNMFFIPYKKAKGLKVEDRKTTNKRFL